MPLASCRTTGEAERRLLPLRPTTEVRLDDIQKNAEENPALAVHQMGVFRALYGEEAARDAGLGALEDEAAGRLAAERERAAGEGRWGDAASLSRSLAGLRGGDGGEAPAFTLEYARQQLAAGNTLAAFLAAAAAHAREPLPAEDAALFLKKAVEARQRGAAAFFLGIVDGAGGPGRAGAAAAVPAEYRAFAGAKDTAADMVRGVATVMVDRGFRIERGRGVPDKVLGSAFFVDASGLLVTNYHVIASEVDPAYEGYSRLYLRLGDSSSPRFPAKVVGWDKAMDLALIKAEYTPEYVFSVVDRVSPRVGDTVYAIGSPGGLEKTVTQGIVSARGRRFLQVGDVLQIDAAVNHGNSGGPVVDMSGRLVGIVFAGVEQFQGLNFAVPAERLAAALPAMLAGGKAARPWLGVSVSETARGAEIIYVAPGTPAAEQQIAEGSVIRKLNGREVKAPQGELITALQDALFPARPGELVSLELEAPDGGLRALTVITAARPDVPLAEAARQDSRERMTAPLFGIILAPQAGNSLFTAYLIKRVVRGSIADETGLSENDPMSIRGFKVFEKEGYAELQINIKKRRMGYLETTLQLYAPLESPDTL
ncbi:MAG: S1C family serine protease [Treponematales bacterium]